MKINLSAHYSQHKVVTKRNDEKPVVFDTLAQALNDIDVMREEADEVDYVSVTVDAQIWDELMLGFLAHSKNQ